MTKKDSNNKWLTSKEAMKSAKIKSCDLMHLRVQGKIKFEKKGNAYFYSKESLEKADKNIG